MVLHLDPQTTRISSSELQELIMLRALVYVYKEMQVETKQGDWYLLRIVKNRLSTLAFKALAITQGNLVN